MSWKDGLSDENKANAAFTDIGDDINDLAKNFLDNEAYKGNSIRIPGEDADEASITAFHTKLQSRVPGLIPTPDFDTPGTVDAFLKGMGKPDKADEYEMPNTDGVEVNAANETMMRDTALELGMTKKQLNGFLTKVQEAEASNIESGLLSQAEALQGLKNKWGVTYTPRMEALKANLLLSEAPSGLMDIFNDDRLPPDSIEWFNAIFSKFTSESTNLDPDDKGDNDGVDVEEARSRAAEIRTKLTSNTIQPASQQYKDLLAKMMKYEKMANPGSSSDINDLRAGVRSSQSSI